MEKIIDLSDSGKVLTWNSRILGFSGIWPLDVRDFIFLPYFIYGCIIVSCGCLSIFDNISNFDYVLSSLTENILMLTTLTKMATFRINRRHIGQFIQDVQKDYTDVNYKNKQERGIFFYYNQLSYRFITIAVPSMTIVLIAYFVANAISSALIVASNSSLEYQLPYKIRPLVKPHDLTTFVLGCFYQFLSIPLIVSGYVGIDCLFGSFALHVTAQFAILKYRVEEILRDISNCKRAIRTIVTNHCRVIRMAEVLEDNFNIIILHHLLGSTFQLCLSGYQMLVCSARGDGVQVIVFIFHSSGLLSTLFVYCYVGECLKQESASLDMALYDFEWYTISRPDLKSIYFCMMRSRKPLQLTSAKFCALSLCTFADIVKASMGYLSVLRTFL